ncbi:Methyl-accepting chemotaxis protein IV [BD1-7 clade bacterium]|uniref:Methyl-accepting chemotaxis protein IV n=1 Tax=BD1-7 clade bacterium TaxID=2029982 RepID=A0A5S9PHK9_9GAMM|nr:Methyl-accepting chemotaxis protein IV [BD1-7 clade bacterium]
MVSIKEAAQSIVGSEQQFTIQQRIFNAIVMYSAVLLLFAGVYYASLSMFVITGFIFLTCGVYCVIYWLTRFADQLQLAVAIYAIAFVVLMNGMWVVNNGVSGTTPFFSILVIVMISFTATKPGWYVAGMVVNLITISTFENDLQALVNISVPDEKIGAVGSLIAVIIFLGIMCSIYRKSMNQRLDGTLVSIVDEVESGSASVNSTSENLSRSGERLLGAALQQSAALEQLSTTTEELSATAEQNSRLSRSAMDAVTQSNAQLQSNHTHIEQLVDSIEAIRKSSHDIRTINNLISDIAYQTNILSLNAMIEASRIESENSGFKVVALEVKNLAERSTDAAKNIEALLNGNNDSVEQSVKLAETMQQQFVEMADGINPLMATIQNVHDASREQNEAIAQITTGLFEINHGVDENRALAQVSSEDAEALKVKANSLDHIVKSMKNTLAEYA